MYVDFIPDICVCYPPPLCGMETVNYQLHSVGPQYSFDLLGRPLSMPQMHMDLFVEIVVTPFLLLPVHVLSGCVHDSAQTHTRARGIVSHKRVLPTQELHKHMESLTLRVPMSLKQVPFTALILQRPVTKR